MIAAGTELLLESGVQVVAEGLTLDAVQRRAGLARSTAYEAWSEESTGEPPQEALRKAVLMTVAAERIGRREIEATAAALRDPGVDKIIKSGDREMATRTIVWQAALANLETRRASKAWLISVAAYGAAASTPGDDVDRQLTEVLNAARSYWIRVSIDEIYAPFGAILGLRPRPHIVHPSGEPWMTFAHAAAAIADGFAPVYTLDPDQLTGVRFVHEGTSYETTVFGLALDATVSYFLEKVPSSQN